MDRGTFVTAFASLKSLSLFLALAACCFVGLGIGVFLLSVGTDLAAVAPAAVMVKHLNPLSSLVAKATLQWQPTFI